MTNNETTPTNTIHATTKLRRRVARTALWLAALIASAGVMVVDSSPASAAGQTTVCFSHYSQSARRYQPSFGVVVTMYYWTGSSWTPAPTGTQRNLDSNGCATYQLAAVPSCNGWQCDNYLNWSGHYVSFAVNTNTNSGLTHWRSNFTQYVSPGAASYNLSGIATCSGVLCP